MKIPLFCVLVLAAAYPAASAGHFVDYDNPLIPIGLRPGDSFHLVFATSGTTNRDAGDGADTFPISHWNTFVNNQAAASTITAIQPAMAALTWNAVVSTTTVAARNNALVSAPVYRIDGELVATGFDDLWNGSVMAPIELTQNLTVVPGAQQNLVYTGSTSAGFPDNRYPLGNGTQSAKTGRAARVDAGWVSGSDAERRNPTVSLRMYAMSELITIAIPPDTDGDGLPDWWEKLHFGGPTAANPNDDPDGDGLTNIQEYELDARLSPVDFDTDNDGLLDGHSITITSDDPRHAIFTNAGISYFDTGAERTFRGELTMGTDPMNPDTDGDGLLDGVETNTGIWVGPHDTGTDPLNPDSDGDGLLDGVETNTGIFVSKSDTGTNPLLADTDGDGAGDWYEVYASFTDPNDPNDVPNAPYPLPRPDGSAGATDKPVKVYIIMGQSNATGIANVNGFEPGTLETIVKREGKFPNLVDDSHNWLPRNDVLYRRAANSSPAAGPLAPGQGASSSQLGPELGFGQMMGWYHDEPVLILKASQGNRSLGGDFLPPGSPRREVDGITYAGYGDSPRSWPTGTTPVPDDDFVAGRQYDISFRNPPDNAVAILADFATNYPQWASQGYEIGGFVWWQGHWDQLTSLPYADFYEENLVNYINAVRAEFNAPNAPFVVATIGFGGEPLSNKSEKFQKVFNAQMAVQDLPEFIGNVRSVDILKYWRTAAESPSNDGTHYNRNAETYMLVGDAAGRAMIELQDDESPPTPINFQIPPTPQNPGSIGMLATTANDPSGPVEYWFEIVGGANSGWTTSRSWEISGLVDGQSYDFRFKARDAVGNESDWSATASATATAAGDTTAPSPNPMTFAAPFTVLGENSIAMTATTASDINGVEYYFEETSGNTGGSDSGWQDSPTYVNNGLQPETTYTYRVRARDKSPAQNATEWSAEVSATTEAPDITPPVVIEFSPANGSTSVPIGTLLEVIFDEEVVAATGFITVKNLSDDSESVINVTDGSQVSVEGSALIINLAGTLDGGTPYAVQISSQAIEDLAGNAFVGIADDTTWSFTTASATDGVYRWTGAVDGDWENPANWDANGVPVDVNPGRSGLSFQTSEERIVIDAINFSPTLNVPQLNPNNNNGEVTATVDVINGSASFSLNSSITGFNIIDQNISTTVGDGDTGNGLASLTYSYGTNAFRRGGQFNMGITVNRDGSLIFNSTSTLLSYDANRNLHVTLAGGDVSFTGTVNMLRNSTAAGNSWFDFTAPGATFTARFGADFADLATVVTYIGSGLTFRSSTNLDLVAADNGDGTFTVTTSDPGLSAYDTWAAQIPDPNLRGRNDDADGDGFTNAQEFLFGTSPIEPNGSLTTMETSGSDLIIRWKQRTSGALYTLLQSSTLENDWIPSSVAPVNDGSAVGDYQPRMATIPIGPAKLFLRVEAVEN